MVGVVSLRLHLSTQRRGRGGGKGGCSSGMGGRLVLFVRGGGGGT